jgi:hypothetical protein
MSEEYMHAKTVVLATRAMKIGTVRSSADFIHGPADENRLFGLLGEVPQAEDSDPRRSSA